MLKLHVPWEKEGWNFYGIVLFSGNQVVDQVGKVGGALRAEVVLGPLEVAGEVVARSGTLPRLGLDASLALWEIDFYGEASLGEGTPNGLPQWDMLTPPDWQATPPSIGDLRVLPAGLRAAGHGRRLLDLEVRRPPHPHRRAPSTSTTRSATPTRPSIPGSS